MYLSKVVEKGGGGVLTLVPLAYLYMTRTIKISVGSHLYTLFATCLMLSLDTVKANSLHTRIISKLYAIFPYFFSTI